MFKWHCYLIGLLHLQCLSLKAYKMSTYDQVEIEDMTFDPDTQIFSYPCPCGDKFQIFIDDMFDGEDVAVCPSCSLMIQVIFEKDDLVSYYDEAGAQPPEPIAVAA